jgi:hypothetical protein
MARTAAALIALALLISASEWMFTATAARVDLLLIPSRSRRRVRWLMAHSGRIHLAAAGTVTSVALVQAAVLVT